MNNTQLSDNKLNAIPTTMNKTQLSDKELAALLEKIRKQAAFENSIEFMMNR